MRKGMAKVSKKKRRENEEEERQKRIDAKERQLLLTKNLQNAYSAIKPTNIQGQRILKIVETVQKKLEMAKYLDYRFLDNFVDEVTLEESKLDHSIIAEISKRCIKFMKEISRVQRDIFILKEKDYIKPTEDDSEEEDEDSMINHEDLEEAEEEQENEDMKRERINRAEKVLEYKDQMSAEFRNFVRYLERSPQDFELIKVIPLIINRN